MAVFLSLQKTSKTLPSWHHLGKVFPRAAVGAVPHSIMVGGMQATWKIRAMWEVDYSPVSA